MLTLRVDEEIMEMKAFLATHKVRWQPEAKRLIRELLSKKCKEFKRKEKEISMPF
jgi:hypothetical protein